MVEMRVDRQEAFEIIVSILAIALALTFATPGGLKLSPTMFIFSMAAYTITLGSGFVLHELAHKYYAIKYGCRARFQAWPIGLVFGLALAIVPQFFGWQPLFFIAPGAVYIYAMRPISIKENGIISLAGPATNWVLAFTFLALSMIFSGNVIMSQVAYMGAAANMGLAMFNLLPIFPLDGSKVFAWDLRIWVASFGFSFLAFSMFGL